MYCRLGLRELYPQKVRIAGAILPRPRMTTNVSWIRAWLSDLHKKRVQPERSSGCGWVGRKKKGDINRHIPSTRRLSPVRVATNEPRRSRERFCGTSSFPGRLSNSSGWPRSPLPMSSRPAGIPKNLARQRPLRGANWGSDKARK